jgi:hypothetical protein
VRQQLLLWTPLQHNQPSLVEMQWFTCLADWESDAPNQVASIANEDDKQLLAQVTEKHAVARVRLEILYRWHPTLTHETQALMHLVHGVQDKWPHREALLDAILLPIKRSIVSAMNEINLLSVYSQATTDAAKATCINHYHQTIKVCLPVSYAFDQ